MTLKLMARFVRSISDRANVMILAITFLSTTGCGEQRAAPVNVELARSTLTDVLEHWKTGGTIDELRSRSPEIIVQEAIWTNGRTLEDFILIDNGREEDANWYCEVELTLAPKDGNEPTKKKVTYVVGTDPVLTVFHAIL